MPVALIGFPFQGFFPPQSLWSLSEPVTFVLLAPWAD